MKHIAIAMAVTVMAYADVVAQDSTAVSTDDYEKYITMDEIVVSANRNAKHR